MKLEKGKVYKIQHYFAPREYDRDYIIFSPIDDIILADDYFIEYNYGIKSDGMNVFTIFTVCFSGKIRTENEFEPINPHGHSSTGVDRFGRLLPLTNKDYEDLRRVVDELGEGYKYNRKLNEIVYDSKSKTSV